MHSLLDAMKQKHKHLDRQLQQKKGSALSAEKQAEIAETFKHFDKNESGTLSRSEFLGALKGLGRDYSDEEATVLFSKHKGKKDQEMTFEEFTGFMKSLETITVTPGQLLDSIRTLSGDGGAVTRESIEKELGPEAAEYFATMAPAAPGGGLDFKAYVEGVFAKTAAPAAAPPCAPGSPRAPSRRGRAKSVRTEAAEISFAAVDPPSDDERGAPPPLPPSSLNADLSNERASAAARRRPNTPPGERHHDAAAKSDGEEES